MRGPNRVAYTYAFIDNGSGTSLISAELARTIGLKQQPSKMAVQTLHGSQLMDMPCRFRRIPVAVTADMIEIFLQARREPIDRRAFSFLWWDEGKLELPPRVFARRKTTDDRPSFVDYWSPKLVTRIDCLKYIDVIFDPIDFLAPILLPGRLIVQRLRREKAGWDPVRTTPAISKPPKGNLGKTHSSYTQNFKHSR